MKFMLQFAYTPQAWAGLMKNPTDRVAAARSVIEPQGGRLESMYFTFGERDGFVIFEAPDAETAAAASIAVNSTGAFRSLQTTQLVEPDQLGGVLAKAGGLVGGYRVPGT